MTVTAKPDCGCGDLASATIEAPAPEEPGRAAAVLDAEALRTLAAVDDWWARITRPCVLTPHTGEFARLRAGSGHEPDEDGDLTTDDAARVRAAVAAIAGRPRSSSHASASCWGSSPSSSLCLR